MELALSNTTFDTSIGARESGILSNLYLGTFSVASAYVFAPFDSGSVISDASGSASHYIGSITGASASDLYESGVSIAPSASATLTPVAREITVFALNTAGAIGGHSAARLGGYSAGLGLSAGQAASFSSAMLAFNTAIGRA
jgi:hypothetical protein